MPLDRAGGDTLSERSLAEAKSEVMKVSRALPLTSATAVRSDLLERPLRVLGRSQTVWPNPSALVILTGNGLTLSGAAAAEPEIVARRPVNTPPPERRWLQVTP
jgi:hypothetical protein